MAGRARRRAGLESFFAPESVAVIGASVAERRPGRMVIENLVANRFPGAIHPVNPRGGEILGLPVSESIAALPDEVDLAVSVLPAAQAVETVRACAAKGMKSVVLAAGGFAEADHAGEDLQRALMDAVAETGIRVLGPNTAGHISTPAAFTSSFFPLGRAIPRGPISYVAQTGNFTGAMMRAIMSGEHYGVARCIGLGNAVDIDEADVLDFLADDPATAAAFLYIEGLHRPAAFLKAAARMSKTKPVVMLKGGATAEGARAAQSHTASLGADDRILDGALRQAGIVRIGEFSELFTAAKAAALAPLPKGPRVGYVSPSGAFIVHISDLARQRLAIEFPSVGAATMRRLQAMSPPIVKIGHPVDVFPAATVHGMEYAYREAISALLEDRNIDAVVAILILVEELGVPDLSFIPELARAYPEKPVYISFSGDEGSNAAAKAFLEPQGVPTFPRIEDPFKVLDVLARCRAAMGRARQ